MRLTMALAMMATMMATAPLAAQERPAGLVGSGVAPSDRASSPERPIGFASSVPTGAALIIPVTAPLDVAKAAPGLSAATAAAIMAGAKAAAFEPGALNSLRLHDVGGHPVVLLVGLKPEGATPTQVELADVAGTGIQALRSVAHPIAVLGGGLPAGSAHDLALGASLGQYRFDQLKSAAKAPPAQPITIASPDAADAARAFAADGAHLAAAVKLARDLVNMPANILYPESFVARVTDAVRGVPNVRVTVLTEAEMRRMGMGAILSVAQGSPRPARLLAIEYRGAGNAAPLALVGKGITFDTGGNNLKPGTSMALMKGDMSGAAGVMGAAVAAARRGAKTNFVAVAALAENMPGGNASRPSDVVRTLNGQTVEITSTDAEGRMVLVDANQWAIQQYRPSAVVNLATLTGSIVGALGPDYAGLFARDEALGARMMAAGKASGEELWRMPLHPNYVKRLASDVADYKHGGGAPGAGTSAMFISLYTPQPTPWAHVDMAGKELLDQGIPTGPKGGIGYGVRMMDQLIRQYEAQ